MSYYNNIQTLLPVPPITCQIFATISYQSEKGPGPKHHLAIPSTDAA